MTPSRVSSWVQPLHLAGADRISPALSKLQLGPQLGVRESGHCVGAAVAWVSGCLHPAELGDVLLGSFLVPGLHARAPVTQMSRGFILMDTV